MLLFFNIVIGGAGGFFGDLNSKVVRNDGDYIREPSVDGFKGDWGEKSAPILSHNVG